MLQTFYIRLGTHYYPYHFVMTNNTQEAAYLQSVSSSGSWNPPLAPEISPFDTVSATVPYFMVNPMP